MKTPHPVVWRSTFARGISALLRGLLIGIGGLNCYPAFADAVVTRCHLDDEAGPGINLTQALSVQDPLQSVNNVTFQCGDAATIIVSHSHEIAKTTLIDGGGKIVLDGVLQQSDMFVGKDTDVGLFLNNLTIRRAEGTATSNGSVVQGKIGLVLNHTRIEQSVSPIALTDGSLGVHDSQLIENSGTVITGTFRDVLIERSQLQNPKALSLSINGNGGTVRILNSQFSNHGSGNGSGSIDDCTLIIERSSFLRHNAPQIRGGVFEIGCNTTISHTIFADNHAGAGGALYFFAKVGSVTLTGVRFINNSATGRGGAIAFQRIGPGQRTLTIRHGTFIGNSAESGGAIDDDIRLASGPDNNQVTVVQGTAVNFSKNSARGDGGAIRGTSMAISISRGIFADNESGASGGAIALRNFGRALHSTFANTLFVRNRAAAFGGALSGEDGEFINSTVDSNVGGGIFASASTPQTRPMRFVNSIVSRNMQGNCQSPPGDGIFIDGGHNLQFPGNECGTSIPVADPILDPMYIPVPRSPPVEHGDNRVCMDTPINRVDVYGLLRPQGSACTIGAAEGDIQLLRDRWRERHCRAAAAPTSCDLTFQQFWSSLGFGSGPTSTPYPTSAPYPKKY